MKSLMKWPLLCGFFIATTAPMVNAGNFAGDTYINNALVSYPGTEPQPPMIDATNFINNSTFDINFTAPFSTPTYFNTWDTLSYVNNALMNCNSGFLFENRSSASGARTPSASFYNPGTIICGSTNATFLQFFFASTFAQCYVSATNILNPGQISVATGGKLQVFGENVDLTRGTLSIGGLDAGNTANAGGTGTFGINTNFWDPSFALTPTTAYSSFIQFSLFNASILFLTNSTPYFDVNASNPTNVIIRAVFIEDTSAANVAHQVFFDQFPGSFSGGVHVEWSGTYTDPASGGNVANYLYLNNDYILGASTNIFYINGIPDNFTFYGSNSPVAFGVPATVPGYINNIFPPGTVTNRFSYANANLIASTVDTNTVPNLSVTNLSGRVEISATKELNLANTEIFGLNYLSIQSPHQFDGSPGAYIAAPYSDINVGVTNGFLTVSNLTASTLPNWSGNVECWSTRWLVVNNGITNDYRVMLVRSRVQPTSPTIIQDMTLHGTNSIVISDTLNILRDFKADAENLTLTTNETSAGANSFAGEINVGTPNVFWSSALPRLRNLTNNGAIRLQNLALFNGTSNTVTTTPGSPATSAHGTLSAFSTGVNLAAGNTVTIGTNKYLFVKKLTNSVPNQVKVGTKLSASMSNLVAAINGTAGSGVNYSTNTRPNVFVTASTLISNRFMNVTARVPGTFANGILTTNKAVNLTWNGHLTLFGGSNSVAGTTNITGQPVGYYSMVNAGLISDQGSTVDSAYFQSSGNISNGVGSFLLQSKNTLLTNGSITAGGDVSITTGTLITSNLSIVAGRGLFLRATNFITDTGVTNGNYWMVGGTAGVGLNLTIRPTDGGDLLGTTVSNVAPANKVVANTWCGRDLGAFPAGYTNNQSLGRLILNGQGTFPLSGSFSFTGVGPSNALYVDTLEFIGSTTNRDGFGNVTALNINTNLVIYYAQALQSGVSVAQKINHKNGDRLRWISDYAGYFSSTNLVYPPDITNVVNTALVQSSTIDSDGDGIVNALDATPLFVPQQINLTVSITNLPPMSVRVQWDTIPNATNFVCFSTNMIGGPWVPLTNFTGYYYGAGQFVTNSAHKNQFVSPQSYPGPMTNVWIFDPIGGSTRYYKVAVHPWSTYPF